VQKVIPEGCIELGICYGQKDNGTAKFIFAGVDKNGNNRIRYY